MTQDSRRRLLEGIVAEVKAENPMPERYADLDPQTRHTVDWNASRTGLDPEAYYRLSLADDDRAIHEARLRHVAAGGGMGTERAPDGAEAIATALGGGS